MPNEEGSDRISLACVGQHHDRVMGGRLTRCWAATVCSIGACTYKRHGTKITFSVTTLYFISARLPLLCFLLAGLFFRLSLCKIMFTETALAALCGCVLGPSCVGVVFCACLVWVCLAWLAFAYVSPFGAHAVKRVPRPSL
jgi:hypothetical protein